MRRVLAILFLIPAACGISRAQFYTSGAENPGITWGVTESENFRIIHPRSADSLAREYAASLESFREALGTTAGFVPNQFYKKRMPVILHTWSAESNGLVTWAPRRMELFANPESYDPDPSPWMEQLAVHEGRHVAQMQLGKANKAFRVANAIVGELWPGAVAAMYPGPALLEGDAVVAETALTASGRGRTADFLEYYRVCFADSLYRNFWQWRWGSQKHFTPDYYRAGYMLIAGMRTTFGQADFYKKYNSWVAARTLPVFNLQKSVREGSGLPFSKAWNDIQESFAREWAEQEAARGPHTEGRTLTRKARMYDSYRSLTFAGGDTLLAIRSALDRASQLVRVLPDGSTEVLGAFSSGSSRLEWDALGGRLLWTEWQPSPLYPMESYSRLRYSGNNGQKYRNYVIKGRIYNPAASGEYAVIAVVQYYENGENSVKVLSSRRGVPIEEYIAPAGIQPVEPVWIGRKLYVSGISAEGSSIYALPGWVPLLEPAHSKINRLFAADSLIWFTSDRNGVGNLHSLNPETGELLQRTSTRFGGKDYVFAPDGDLYYTAPTVSGREIRVLPADSLIAVPVEFCDFPSPSSGLLSAQEPVKPSHYTGEISAPKPYRKLLHPTKIHSWAPAYIDYNPISRLSLESTASTGTLGATLFMQDELGSGYGMVGASLLDDSLALRPAIHAQYVWSGWGPQFELRADFGERPRHGQYFTRESSEDGMNFPSTVKDLDGTFTSFTAAVSLPFNLSGGGWNKGIIPYARFSWNNDVRSTLDVKQLTNTVVIRINEHKGVLMSKVGVRAYAMRPIASSCIFPRYGIGLDVGFTDTYALRSTYPGHGYVRLYGYTPGLLSTHGLRLDAEYRRSHRGDWVNSDNLEASADYAFPFAPVDWSFLCPIAYIRNFEGILHAGMTAYHIDSYVTSLNKSATEFNVGGTLMVRLANFLWIPYDTRIGVKYLHDFAHPEKSGASFVMGLDF